jgi:hypothetical protein
VERTGEWNFLKDGDSTQYPPGLNYYKLKDYPNLEKIVIAILSGKEGQGSIREYQILQRVEPVVAPNNKVVFSSKGDPKEIKVALDNIHESISFLHELKVENLEPILVSLHNDGESYKVQLNYTFIPIKQGNQKFLFINQYEKGYTDKGTFYSEDQRISTFSINGITWVQYKENYFIGTKNGSIYEVKSQNFSSQEVKNYLHFFVKSD